MKKNIVFFVVIILFIFRAWFLLNPLSAGDWSFNFPQTLKSFTILPYIWNWTGFVTGLGGNIAFFLGLSTYFSSTASILSNFFNIQWVLIERLVWFWPFLIISVFSPFILYKKIFLEKFAFLASFIYLLNTYIFMLVGGGQMGIAIVYSLVPLLFLLFFNLMSEENFKNSLIFSLILSILVLLDLRVAYIALFGVFIYWLLRLNEIKKFRKILKSFLIAFGVPGIVTILINSFWIMPLIFGGKNPLMELGSAYSSLEAVKFFSFAKLENTIGLMHPNWPENVFGKVGFMKPEFLILPVIAFSSLLFIKNISKEKRFNIMFFVLLGFLGIFLAKGANDPFGGIYLWLFDNFPGFVMFRDPTKWYTLIALSYSILIPFTIWNIFEYLKKYKKIRYAPQIFLVIVITYLLFLIRPALLGQLSGTFKSTQIPDEYVRLERFISSQNNFSRTLWVPTLQRFGYYSNSHPAIPAQNLFKTVENSEIIKKMETRETELLLQEAAVKYVIIPNDSQGEIFLKDRKYTEKMYLQVAKGIDSIGWLEKIGDFGKIKVYEVLNPKDHFWTTSSTLNLKYKFISPVEYKLEVKNAKIGDKIIFSESYDASWIARDSNTKFYDWPNLMSSNPYSRVFNSFTLRKAGDYSLIVFYYPQTAVNLGVIISISTSVLVLAFIIFGRKLKKW